MSDTKRVFERIVQKKQDYIDYSFSSAESSALTTFFDLSQEFDSLDDFYALCVGIPKIFFGLDACLYMMHEKLERFALAAKTTDDRKEGDAPGAEIRVEADPYLTEQNSLILSIKGREVLMGQLPFKTVNNIIGILELLPFPRYSPHRMFYFRKYANRIGYNLHNKFLALKNEQHLRFIRVLVADIEHNVIVPNMIYRLYLRQLNGRIQQAEQLEARIAQGKLKPGNELNIQRLHDELSDATRGLRAEYEHIERHYSNMSLFLETLLRRSHFDHGRLILRTKICNLKKEVLDPQLERYHEQLAARGIAIDDRFSGIPDEETISVVDVGLIAQVYANFFSNAVKYTEAVTTEHGEKKKYISYGREILANYFGEGKDGIKYNVFSTGSHLSDEDQARIFQEGGRAVNAVDRPGSGHGLAFVRNAVEIHGGVVGYEPTHLGNNFFFILPKETL